MIGIKNDPATRHIPVAVISTDESREKALNAGAYSFVAKPIQSKDVLDSLLASLKEFAQRPEKRCWWRRRIPRCESEVVAYLNADDVRIMTVGDRSAAADLVEREGIDCWCSTPSCRWDTTRRPAQTAKANPALDSLPILVYGGEKGAKALEWLAQRRRATSSFATSTRRASARAGQPVPASRLRRKMPEAHRTVLRRAARHRRGAARTSA